MAEVGIARAVEPMTPNTIVENTSPGMKRKAEDDDLKGKGKIDVNGVVQKKAKNDASNTITPLVELKGRKLLYKQDPLPKFAPTRKRMLLFETLLVDAEEEERKVTEIPEENWDIVVLAGYESTARTEALLVKQIKTALKVDDDKELLPNETISTLIPKLFRQEEYGFLAADFAPSASSTKVPASLQIRCWEAINPDKYLTPDQCELIKLRRAERLRVREECLRILDGLDDIEKLELIKGEKGEKGKKEPEVKKEPEGKKDIEVKQEPAGKKDIEVQQGESSTPKKIEASPMASARRKNREGTANTADSRRSMSPVRKTKMTPEEEEAARIRREEKEVRKAQRAEKKAALEREEEKKLAAKAKQQQAMSMFFKAKTAASPVISRESTAGPSLVRQDSPVKMSEYQRTFRPVQRRANVKWAPINPWVKQRRRSQSPSEGRGKGRMEEASTDVSGWQQSDFLRDHLRKHRLESVGPHRRPNGLKTAPPDGPVSEVMVAYQEAADPRQVLERLQDRRRFPWKILAFDQQVRPPYCGTFTKKSAAVGPRTPFAQDPMFDYSYDSGDDWQDDEGGEDVDDFGEGREPDEEEAEGEDESEGEFDDWLDDSEDAPFTPMDADDEILPLAGPTIEQAKLPMKVVKKSQVPRKVVKVTPSWRGPMWEDRLGQGSEGMEGYRLQLLNDTPDLIDPFNYVASDVENTYKTTFSTIAIGTNLSVKCLLSAESVAVKATVAVAPTPSSEAGSSTATALAPKGKLSGPKIAFPLAHLPELLRMIDGNTKIRSDLISQLKAHFDTITSKAAIEAKIKEVAIREGKSKDSQWKVKPEAWAACGMGPNEISVPAQPVMVDSSSF